MRSGGSPGAQPDHWLAGVASFPAPCCPQDTVQPPADANGRIGEKALQLFCGPRSRMDQSAVVCGLPRIISSVKSHLEFQIQMQPDFSTWISDRFLIFVMSKAKLLIFPFKLVSSPAFSHSINDPFNHLLKQSPPFHYTYPSNQQVPPTQPQLYLRSLHFSLFPWSQSLPEPPSLFS